MKNKVFHIYGKKIFYKVYSINDLLSTKEFYLKKDLYLYRLFNIEGSNGQKGRNRERTGVKVSKMIVTEMLKMVQNDLIYNNDTFIFPERQFGYIKVMNKDITNRDNFVYDIDTGGRYYGPKLVIDKDVVKKNKRLHRMRFNSVGRKKILEQLEKNHKY